MLALKKAQGWFPAGSHPSSYEMGLDSENKHGNRNTACIRSKAAVADGFGTLMQVCKAEAFINKRVRLTATVRTEAVEGWVGLWFRIDPNGGGSSLGFDNMQNRSLSGTTDWASYSVVLDVPEESHRLAYGLLLAGTGQAWMADVRIEPVGLDIATTNLKCEQSAPDLPQNLDFAE